MDSFEFNKISAAILSGILLFMVIGLATEALYPEPHVEKLAYSVEVEEEAAGGAAGEKEEGPSLAVLLASADASKGAKTFKQCAACHSIEKGEANKVGPNLYGIIGHGVASNATYSGYSADLKALGGEWTFERMDQWLTSPKSLVGGTSMAFGGIRKAEKRAELIAYLRSKSDAPVDLPAAE